MCGDHLSPALPGRWAWSRVWVKVASRTYRLGNAPGWSAGAATLWSLNPAARSWISCETLLRPLRDEAQVALGDLAAGAAGGGLAVIGCLVFAHGVLPDAAP